MSPKKIDTRLANHAVARGSSLGSVAPPLFLSTTYAWDTPTEKPSYDYSRSGNPTRHSLETALQDLEGGAGAVVTGTGMAAVDLPFCLLHPGDIVLAPHDCYGGTHRLLTARAAKGHYTVDFIDQTDTAALDNAFAQRPKMILIETPSNPLLRITDIRDMVRRAKEVGAITVADNTFLSPILQRPLDLGCDIVLHSTTKYINGHSDVVGGAVIARDKALADELFWWANATGVTGSAFDSYMALRGARTLPLRVARQQDTAGALATWLEGTSGVAKVHYPGLESHSGHVLAGAQQHGFGAMFSVEFEDDIDVTKLVSSLDHFVLAESLGGFESLVCIPALMTHAGMAPAARAEAGITERLVRFSIGLEHVDDLTHDLLRAIDGAVLTAS